MKDAKTNDDVLCEKLIEKQDKKITAIMTTIPSRKDTILSVLDSIYGQVDEIRIVFNGFNKIDHWCDFNSSLPKIIQFIDPTNQYTDCAKWQYVPESGYVFSIDDDIRYPYNYISTMISKIEQYKREAVMTVHGSFFQLPFVGFKESKRSFHFAYKLEKDVRVPMIGTGTLAFHTDTIKPEFKNILPSRSDIWFSALCLKKQIPMIAVQRPHRWLQPLLTNSESIWDKTMADKEFLDENSELIAEYIIPYIEGNIVYC